MSIKGDIRDGLVRDTDCHDPMHEPKARKGKRFPHANDVLIPVQEFNIKGHWLCLYAVTGRTPSAPYSLYWADDFGPPIQHAMTATEVFAVLARLMNCWDPRPRTP